MRGVVWRVVVAVMVLAASRGAAAQKRPGAAYLFGGVGITHQDGAEDGESQLDITAPGGTTAGWTLGGGVFLTRHVSSEGEWSWSGIMTAREPSHYGLTYIEERRDRVLGVMVRIHSQPAGAVDVEPVAGVPGFRVRAGTRGEDLVAYYPCGFPRWTIGGGVTARVRF
jgi:hypothetical protein